MNYLDEFRKYIYGHQLATGVRLTLAVLIPCLIFWHLEILEYLIAFPLGTLLVASTDLPGARHRRRNTLIITVVLATFIAFATSLIHNSPIIIYAFLLVFGMLFSMIGVYGNRASTIGTICLLVLVFNIDNTAISVDVLEKVLSFAAGGIWYIVLYLALDRLRPFQPIQQLMGANLDNLGKLLKIKSSFYFKNPDYLVLHDKMLELQIDIRENQDNLRETLFQTRRFTRESSNKSRILMLMFLDSIDLMEQIMNSQQDYKHLQKTFSNTKILRLFGTYLVWLSNEIQHIGVAVQTGTASTPQHNLEESFHKVELAFMNFRDTNMNHENVEDFMMLRQILNAMRDITERIKKLHRATRFEALPKESGEEIVPKLDEIIPPQEYHPRILADNFSLKSGHFRHSIRLTLALLIGYTISLVSDIGHGHWILLTIVTIMKPAFSITRQRNTHRLTGTLVGGFLGFFSLYWIDNITFLFLIMFVSMIIAYTYIKTNYFVASIAITIYVLISFSFISPHHLNDVLVDRILDTLIGSAIAAIVSFFILPTWETDKLEELIQKALQSNDEYFMLASKVFIGEELEISLLKQKRKTALIELANLSDAFQRMMTEPKHKRTKLEDFHQFVATSHMLTSYIASLSSYAQTVGNNYQSNAFKARIREIERNFNEAYDIINNRKIDRTFVIRQPLPQNDHLIQLLGETKKAIKDTGNEERGSHQRSKQLSDLRTIDGLFELIHSITTDEVKILSRIFPTFPSKA